MKNQKKMDKKQRIYIVEDEPDILELIFIHLIKAGYDVEKFSEAGQMFEHMKNKSPDLVILDLMLPDYDGMEVCKILKKSKHYAGIPIIMVTAKTEEIDIVLGLELGADDYIPKPFSPRELVARVKAVLRRNKGAIIAESEPERINIADLLVIDSGKHEVLVKGQNIQLTFTEFSILKLLAQKQGWVFSREKILDTLWKDEKDVFDRTIDVHIKNLRDKLGPAGDLIKNVRGVGYKIGS